MRDKAKAMREKDLTDEEKIAVKEKNEKEIRDMIENFDLWDYVVLEAIRRENFMASIKIGTMRYLTAAEKLHYCGMIKWRHDLDIDEREKLQEFYDSVQYKAYKDRLEKVTKYGEFVDINSRMKELTHGKKYSKPHLTPLGLEHLQQQREKTKVAWLKLKEMRDKGDMEAFAEQSKQDLLMMPMFLLFGFANGALLSAMMLDAGINDVPFSGEIGTINMAPSYDSYDYGMDGGGIDFGGFF